MQLRIYTILYTIVAFILLSAKCSNLTISPKEDKPTGKTDDQPSLQQPAQIDNFLGTNNKYLAEELMKDRGAVEKVLQELYDASRFHETHVLVCEVCKQQDQVTYQQFCEWMKKYAVGTRRYGSWKEEPTYKYEPNVAMPVFIGGIMLNAILVSPELWHYLTKRQIVGGRKCDFQPEPFNFQRCGHCLTEESIREFEKSIDENKDRIAQVEAKIVKDRLKALQSA